LASILVLGGYGVFGGRLSERLVRQADYEILVAGRSLSKATEHCRVHGGTPLAIDRDGDNFLADIARRRPAVVIDAAGPFLAGEADPYRVARAAIAAGAHYVDLADDGAFVAGICALDAQAKAAGVAVISGASSVPAISAAALDELVRGLATIAVAGAAILPGNRAPRGLSLMRTIVGQAGRPLRLWRGGAWSETQVWGAIKRFTLQAEGAAPLAGRMASVIGAPDLVLFPERYGARSVLFHAGLELRFMHLGLWALALAVRCSLVRSIAPLARPLKRVADRFEHLGSDRGGMVVYAIGRDRNGRAVERRWTLIAEAGDGPQVPPTPALLLALRLIGGEVMTAGARPALGLLTLADAERGLAPFHIRFGRGERPAPPLLERVMAGEFATLPEAWRRLADIHDLDRFSGEGSVERGSGRLAGMVALLFGFPPQASSVPVSVTKECTGDGEKWTRRFGTKTFVSQLSRKTGDRPGVIRERFGPFSFILDLTARNGRVEWPVERWRFLGIAMPRRLAPQSRSSEEVGTDGKFRFDVSITLPFVGPVIRYRGWLEPSSSQDLKATGSPATAPISRQV
jgi:hypothetical protein